MDYKIVGKKFVEGAMQGALASSGVSMAGGNNPLDPNAMAVAAGTAIATGLIRSLMNWWKHRGKD